MKRKIIALLFVVLLIALVVWSKNQSYLEVVIPGDNGQGQYSYRLLNQGNQKAVDIKTSSGSLKKRLPVADYEVLVTKDGASYFSVVKTHGFFGKTSVSGPLEAERARKFIGNTPGSCMNYIDSVLISYDCGGLLGDAVIHQPATSTQPSYTHKNPSATFGGADDEETTLNGYIQDTVTTKTGVLALIQATTGKGGPIVEIANLRSNLAAEDRVELPDLSTDVSYKMKPFKAGFLVYDSLLVEGMAYYASPKAKPEFLDFTKPQNSHLDPVNLDAHGSNILTLYSQNPTSSKKVSSEFIISSGTNSSHFTVKKSYVKAILCGENIICAVGDKGLDIYDTTGNKIVRMFSVSGATDLILVNDQVVVVRKNDVLSLDIGSRSGFVSYAMGNYEYTSIQPDQAGYILNLLGPQGNLALLVNKGAANTDSIDKKVLAIRGLSGVASVSAYGNYIFISPNLGPEVFNVQTHSFGYDPTVQKTVNTMLDEELKALNIDKKYTVVNVLR